MIYVWVIILKKTQYVIKIILQLRKLLPIHVKKLVIMMKIVTGFLFMMNGNNVDLKTRINLVKQVIIQIQLTIKKLAKVTVNIM